MNKIMFYALSFTWGLPMTLIGVIVSVILLALGYRPKKWGYCWYFELGKGWGGVELGAIFLCAKGSSDFVKTHEFGHSLQNCVFGPLMPFVVCIPSAIRYWYREIKEKIGKPCETGYYDIWFEKQANELGEKQNKMIDR